MIKFVSGAKQYSNFNDLHERLLAYCATKSAGTIQGSAEWKFARSILFDGETHHLTIGGSELPSVIGVNPYKSRNDLLEEKVELYCGGAIDDDDPDKTLNTEWGHIMEPFSRQFLCDYYDTVFYEIDASIPHSTVRCFRLSPDGIGIIAVDVFGHKSLSFVALEIKNPMQRIVKDPPPYYIPQICAAVDVMSELTSYGMFADFNFRIQSVSDYGQPRYSGRIHYKTSINGKRGADRYNGLTVHASCSVFMYANSQEDIARVMMLGGDITTILADMTLVDVGKTTETHVKELFFLISRGTIKVWPESDFGGLLDRAERFKAFCEASEVVPVAIMCASLFKYAITPIFDGAKYVERHRDTLESFVQEIEKKIEERGGFHSSYLKWMEVQKH